MRENYPLERFCRDLKLSRIYEGTNEIQRLAIANEFPKGKSLRGHRPDGSCPGFLAP